MARRANMMVSFTDVTTARSGGCVTGISPVAATWNRHGTEDWDEAQRRLRERLQARDNRRWRSCGRANSSRSDWADFFMENYCEAADSCSEDP